MRRRTRGVTMINRMNAHLEQAHEHDEVVAGDLGQVEVAQRSHEQARLVLLVLHTTLRLEDVLLGTQEDARDLEHRADGAQAPIVVQLLARRRRVAAEQVTRQLVEREELLGKRARGEVALRHQHVLHDHRKVGHHDGHRTELKQGGQRRCENRKQVKGN